MIDSGKYNIPVEIWGIPKPVDGEEIKTDEIASRLKNLKNLLLYLQKIDDRAGSLLTGRPADTILSTTTHKITWPYYNFPNIIPRDNWIVYENKRF